MVKSHMSSQHSRVAFVWGLSLGLLGALGTVVSMDLGWFGPSLRAPQIAIAAQETAPRKLHLTGPLPPAVRVFVDGQVISGAESGAGMDVSVPLMAERIELRGPDGPLWSTRISSAGGDTLIPVLDGEVMIELGHQARGGALYLDGSLVGEAPGLLSNVAPGWHLISVRDGDRILFEDGCVIRSGEVSLVTVPPVPPRGKGRAVIRSRILTSGGFYEDEGASVWVDGEPQGETPLELTLAGGLHSIRVESKDRQPYVAVMAIEAGATRFVSAEFGQEERLLVAARPPHAAVAGAPVAIPVDVSWAGSAVDLSSATLHLVREGQGSPIGVPLVASGTNPTLWVAVVPAGVAERGKAFTGYVECRDAQGREGASEIFNLPVN